MDTNILFLTASRMKLRFLSPSGGNLSVEDLWDLPLEATTRGGANLDDLARGLHKQIKDVGEDVSYVKKTTRKPSGLQMKFDIVKIVIETKLAEAQTAEDKKSKEARKAQLLELIAAKQGEELKGKSVAELTAMIDAI